VLPVRSPDAKGQRVLHPASVVEASAGLAFDEYLEGTLVPWRPPPAWSQHGHIIAWLQVDRSSEYEREGKDRREAERLESRRFTEVRQGTYLPASERKATTFKQWGQAWVDRRTNRTVTHNAKADIVDAYTHWDWAPPSARRCSAFR
jgi:hypothetical protein